MTHHPPPSHRVRVYSLSRYFGRKVQLGPANRRQNLGLVWRNRKKISQIINNYLCLTFFLLIILCSRVTTQGVTKRCRLSWMTNSALVWVQMRGELRGLSQWVQLYTGAQINFRDLTPYLKVPKCEIFDRSDFPDFYTIKSSWVCDLLVKILTYYLNFWES